MTREIILGPPGTGKTTTLLGLVEDELSSGTSPDRIGYVSFTKKASEEAVSRAVTKFNLDRKKFRWFSTIHSLCYRQLGLSRGDVFSESVIREFGDLVGVRISGKIQTHEGILLQDQSEGDRMMFMENLSRIKQIPLQQQWELDNDGFNWWQIDKFAKDLRHFKQVRGLLDYTDMLQAFIDEGTPPDIEVLFVDEAQDLSPLQWRVVDLLAIGCRRVVIAGDDDQAIYQWAGADVAHFVNMEGSVRVLDRSWRVPKAVQGVAGRILSDVLERREKRWQPRDEEGKVERIHSVDEVDLSTGSILILARNSFVLNKVEEAVRGSGYLYSIRGRSSIKPDILTAIRYWESLRQGNGIPAEMARKVYSYMSSGKGVRRGYKELRQFPDGELVTMNDLKSNGGLMRDDVWFEALDRIASQDKFHILRVLRNGEKLKDGARITMSTIHASKGGEADKVILLPDMAQRTFQEAKRWPENESRVWYVAATRAKQELYLVKPSISRHFRL